MSSYSISIAGKRDDAMKSLDEKIKSEGERIASSGGDVAGLEQNAESVRQFVRENARDGDTVSVTMNGHHATSPTSVGTGSSFGITVTRAATADASNPHATDAEIRAAGNTPNPTNTNTSQPAVETSTGNTAPGNPALAGAKEIATGPGNTAAASSSTGATGTGSAKP